MTEEIRERFRQLSFFKLIYNSSYMKAFDDTDIDIEKSCAEFYKYLGMDDYKTSYVVGEWEHLNRKRSQKNQAVVGITAAVNALIDTKEVGRASQLYNSAKLHGLPENAYINNRIAIM